MNSSTSPFGPQYVFGQSSHLKVHVPTSGVTSFGSSTGASVFGGPSAGVFEASSSTFTTSSSPAFGWTSAGLGVPTGPFGSQYIFGQSSNPNGAEVSAPTSGVAPFGSQEGTSVFGGASTGVFGATASPLSSTSALATTSSPAIWGSSPGFGGNSDQTSTSKCSAASAVHSHKPDGVHDDHQAPRGDSAIVDEPALKITYSFPSTGFSGGADVMKLIPKLRHTDYYIEPRIEELAVKEISESGFCSHVKDFVVGRLGYGSIMFLGETDVREFDIESHVQFNDREVVVYMDETKKPPVGEGLNKPAEITLCNIRCIDKKTGKQYIDGPKVDKYKETLMKKTAEQGAEFVSYDPVQGDWKFKVQHF